MLVDSSYDLFFRPTEISGVKIAPPPRAADFRRSLHNEWGLSLWLESERAAEKRTVMLDFGYTPATLLNNMELTGVDPSKIDALVVSHGHYDHFGGLQGFLDKYRSVLPADVKLYAGGEDNFCHRVQGNPQQGFADFGKLDRGELASKKIATVLAESPAVVAGHAFTTGKIARNNPVEKVLPNTSVDYTKEGAACDYGHYTAGRTARQDRARPARPRARDLLQHQGQGPRGDLLLRPRRHREFGAAGAGGVRHSEGARGRRRLPSRPRAEGLPQAGRLPR